MNLEKLIADVSASWNEKNQLYYEKAEEYYQRFGKRIPREMMPDYISDDDIIRAIELSLEQGKDVLFDELKIPNNSEGKFIF